MVLRSACPYIVAQQVTVLVPLLHCIVLAAESVAVSVSVSRVSVLSSNSLDSWLSCLAALRDRRWTLLIIRFVAIPSSSDCPVTPYGY